MALTEAQYPELSADLVEQVRNLPTDGLESLERLLEEARSADIEHEAGVRAEVICRIEAYDRGEIQASDWREVSARVEAKLKAAFPEAQE